MISNEFIQVATDSVGCIVHETVLVPFWQTSCIYINII